MPYREVAAPAAPAQPGDTAALELELRPYFRRARLVLLLATSASLVGLVIVVTAPGPRAVLPIGAGAMLVVLFGACALASHSHPLAASGTALAACATLQIAFLVVAPLSFFDGLLWKAFLFGALVSGVQVGYRVRDLRRQARRSDRKVLLLVACATVAAGVGLGVVVRVAEYV